MQSEWRNVLLEDVATEITVGYVGPMTSEYIEDGVPFLRSKNVEPLRINTDDIKYISQAFHQKVSKSRLAPGDVVIVRTGKPGSCAVIPDWLENANCSDLVIVRCGEEINNRFLTYYVNTAATGHISAHLVGAVQQHFNVASARALNLKLPPLEEQEAIVSILGSLDDKIELNRQMNATLEAMAQALFKSWFVDFDPVLDNALAAGNPIPDELQDKAAARETLGDARKPLPEDIAALFPAAFVWTEEMGWIPEGWEAKPFSEFTKESRERAGEKQVPEYSSTNNGLFPRDERFKKQLAKSQSNNKIVKYGDLVFGMSREVLNFGLMKDSIGSVSSAYNIFTVNQSVIFPEFVEKYIRHKEHLYFNMRSSSSREGQSLSKTHFLMTPMLIPSQQIQQGFKYQASLITDLVTKREQEIETLVRLRDTLLPKLLSGELRIPDAEKLVEDALV